MLRAGLEGLRASPADATHPNSTGHHIMASIVGGFILEQGLLEQQREAPQRTGTH
jgi:phospholipase/lecithinase/hemolysin